jgi:hypothetical protein
MQSTAKPKRTGEPRDFVMVPSDQVKVVPSDAEITDLLRAAARRSETGSGTASNRSGSAIVPAVDTTFRATDVNDDLRASRRSSVGRRVMRAILALLLAAGIGGAAVGWQFFGYAAKKAFARWLPQMALTTSFSLDKLWPGTDSQPAAAPAEPVAAEEAPAETTPAAPAQATPDSAAVNAATPPAAPSDSAQVLQSMARDLANANQEIEALKASIAELKASQQQMIRERTAEQSAKARLAATPPHPPVARKPAPVYSPTPTPLGPAPAPRPAPSYAPAQAAPPPPAAQPYVSRVVEPPPIPLQPQTEQGGLASVPRPPMPVQQQ